MAYASRPSAHGCCGSQLLAVFPTAPACRTHRADIRDTPPTESGNSHNAKPRSADRRHVYAVATGVCGPQRGAAAAAMRDLPPHETSPRRAPSIQADVARTLPPLLDRVTTGRRQEVRPSP